jgi:hypothetical protein
MTFKVERIANRQAIVLRLCGHAQAEHVSTIEELIARENGSVELDLSEITLVDLDVVRCLALCAFSGIELRNCPAFIQDWINKEKLF